MFSIITVCLNAGDNLILTIESALNQTYSDFEIIVKDGFSTDGSVEMIPKDDRIRLIQKKDDGIYDAMNQGIEVASGQYIIFMNAGDKFYNNKVLANLIDGIGKKPGDLYYGRCYNRVLKVVDPAPKQLTKYFCYRSMICHQATIYSSSMLKRRGYDVTYTVSADRERMLYAVLLENVKCVYLPIIVVSFQGGGFCTTEKAKKLLKCEQSRMRKCYFTSTEQIIFFLKYQITLPWLRKLIVKNRKIAKMYRNFVSKLYGNKNF